MITLTRRLQFHSPQWSDWLEHVHYLIGHPPATKASPPLPRQKGESKGLWTYLKIDFAWILNLSRVDSAVPAVPQGNWWPKEAEGACNGPVPIDPILCVEFSFYYPVITTFWGAWGCLEISGTGKGLQGPVKPPVSLELFPVVTLGGCIKTVWSTPRGHSFTYCYFLTTVWALWAEPHIFATAVLLQLPSCHYCIFKTPGAHLCSGSSQHNQLFKV